MGSSTRAKASTGFSGRAANCGLGAWAKAGAAKLITKNGESHVALIDAEPLDCYHRLERERIHRLLIDDACRGLADIAAGRTQDADAAIAGLQARRASAHAASGKVSVSPRALPKDRSALP